MIDCCLLGRGGKRYNYIVATSEDSRQENELKIGQEVTMLYAKQQNNYAC